MKRTQHILFVIAAAGVCTASLAQQHQAARYPVQPDALRPVPVNLEAGLPDAGQPSNQLFADRQFFDMPLPGPAHPPIEQIPAMPMPEVPDELGVVPPGLRWADLDDGMTFFDAETGESFVVPVRVPSGVEGGESAAGEYRGVMPFDPSDEFWRGFGTMTAAGSLSTWPRSGNVKLIMRFTDQNNIQRWFTCSGSMSDAGVVLTAAHCVYARSPNGNNIFSFADIVYIYPAWDGNGNVWNAPGNNVYQNFGYAWGTSFLAGTGYINSGDFDRDAGLIRISRGGGSRNVGMLTGWFGWAWGQSCSTIQGRTYHNFSYPAENCPTAGLHNGQTMYYWNGTWDSCPGNQLQLNTGGNCLDTVWGGMSGSGAYYINNDNRLMHAVCSNSNRNDRGRYTKLWEAFINDKTAFENNTRTNSEDWEPLMLRARGSTTVRAGNQMNDSLDFRMVNATNANPPARDYTVRVYLSTNNNVTPSDTLLNTWVWTNRNFGAMANVNFVVPAPTIPIDTPPGNYWLGVIIDPNLPGTTANDATRQWDAQPISVTIGLPATAGSPNPPHNSTGRSINTNLSWGSAPRASSYRVHFGTTTNPPFRGTTSSTSWSLAPLNYNTQYYWRIDTVNSAGTTTGPTWTFRTTLEPLPDLVAELASVASGTYIRGTNINVTHRTRNIGTAASTGTTVQFRASTNNIISVVDTLMDTRNFAGLLPGGVLQTTSSVQIPPTLTPGTYYIGTMVSEPSNNEPNFSNNWVSSTNTITVVDCPADFAPPYGVLNFFDLSAFLNAYNNQHPSADLAPPFGVFNFFDISAYLSLFNQGCP